MKCDAVIFDLYGTLIRKSSVQEMEEVLTEMASVLAAPCDDFLRLWSDTYNQRITGILRSPEANIKYICKKLGVVSDSSRIKTATDLRIGLTRRLMKPRTGAVEVISRLKAKGYLIGLLSDCSAETPSVWQTTPFASLFDVTVFSCKVGTKKPAPGIYLMTAELLGVSPDKCLYVGDGSSNELTGAARVGMRPVLVRFPGEDGCLLYTSPSPRD